MKPKLLTAYIKMSSGIIVDEGQIIWWERKGLLGSVPRTAKNRRDYTAKNANLCMVVVVCKLLRWGLGDVERLVKDKDRDLRDRFIDEVTVLIEKFMPKLKDIVVGLGEII